MSNFAIDLTSLDDNFSGIERFASSITRELIDFDLENNYFLIFKNKVPSEFAYVRPNVKIKVIHCKNKLLSYQVFLPIELYKTKADAYLFLAYPSPFLFFSKRSISTIHDLGCWDCKGCNTRKMELYFRILYKKVAICEKKAITVSEYSKKRIAEILGISSNQIVVTYNGIGDEFNRVISLDSVVNRKVRHRYNLPKNYLLCLSTIEPRKNLRLLVDAYSELLQNKEITHKLVLAGRRGWLTDGLISSLPKEVADNIIFTGFISNEDLPYIYANADLFVFPSLYEGFGIPPVEAMAAGVRVISSDSSCLPEILEKHAIYFRNNDKEDLKEKILFCLAEEPSQKIHESISAKRYVQRFSWTSSAECILETIKKWIYL